MIASSPRFRTFLWGFLVAVLAVVVWGAVVRATGSGAGCGAHWPACNGEIVPTSPGRATLIELFHRITSGLLLGLTGLSFAWGFRAHPQGHPVRRGVTWILIFMVSEAAVGALLVLNGWVGLDASVARALAVGLHLLNTFLLLGAIAATTEWAEVPIRSRERPAGNLLVKLTTLSLLMVGVSGAIAALGDTLFPAVSVSAGFAADTSASAHFLLRLRGLHPLLAALTALGAGLSATRGLSHSPTAKRRAFWVLGLLASQLGVGLLNLALLVPLPLQLIHLLMADLLWIAWVKLTVVLHSSPSLAEKNRPTDFVTTAPSVQS